MKSFLRTSPFTDWLQCMLLAFLSSFVATPNTACAQTQLNQAKDPRRILLIGDSTVKNGTGKGDAGLWGWGELLGAFFETNRVHVYNRALGGRSSRSYFTEGLWDKVRKELKPGDIVLMQFGHNDGGSMTEGRARASIKGIGEETKTVTRQSDNKQEEVHSYGWYLRTYIQGAKENGCIPVVLSPVPRNMWKEEKVLRASSDYGQWARQVAAATETDFIDLNELVAAKYEQLGKDFVGRELFTAADHTHTTRKGAHLNAETVASALAKLPCLSLNSFHHPPQNPVTKEGPN